MERRGNFKIVFFITVLISVPWSCTICVIIKTNKRFWNTPRSGSGINIVLELITKWQKQSAFTHAFDKMDGVPLVSSTGPGAEDAALREEAWRGLQCWRERAVTAASPRCCWRVTWYRLWRTGWQFLKSYYMWPRSSSPNIYPKKGMLMSTQMIVPECPYQLHS